MTDQIGWMVPAVPVDGELAFSGYCSVPQDLVEWWRKLPTRKRPRGTVKFWVSVPGWFSAEVEAMDEEEALDIAGGLDEMNPSFPQGCPGGDVAWQDAVVERVEDP